MLGPGPSDRQLSVFWRKLLSGALVPHGLQGALAELSQMLQASDAQLLRSVPAAWFESASAAVHTFDRGTPQRWLLRVLDTLRADHGLCAVLRQTPHHADVFVLVRKDNAFGEGELSWLELLAPQLHAALDLADRLGTPCPTLHVAGQMVRIFPTPCLLTDEAGRCIERNPSFDKVLAKLPGAVRNGRVVFDDPFLQDSWRQALVEGHATAETQSLLANATSGTQWKVHVVPVACVDTLADATPRRLMFACFEKLAGAATQTKTVQASRPLTKAELEVLASLLLGHTAKIIARSRGASVNTVRSQITSILGKTGHHTQKELIASFSASTFERTLPESQDELH
jgi:DNA-binding CsgD family transcriptional regulator